MIIAFAENDYNTILVLDLYTVPVHKTGKQSTQQEQKKYDKRRHASVSERPRFENPNHPTHISIPINV